MTPTHLILFAFARTAVAQDMDTWELSSGWFRGEALQLVPGTVDAVGARHAGLALVVTEDPVVLRRADGETRPVLDRLAGFTVAGGLMLGEIMEVEVRLPLWVDAITNESAGFAPGDAALSALIPLVRPLGRRVGVVLQPRVAFPTGDAARFVGAPGVSGGAVAAVSAGWQRAGVTGNLGLDVAGEGLVSGLAVGSAVDAGVGGWLGATEALRIGAELDLRTYLAQPFSAETTPLEGHLFATWLAPKGMVAGVAGGTGLLAGVGAPSWRVAVTGGWRGGGAPADQDLDGIVDREDRCPEEAEDLDGRDDADGCPDRDDDGDGREDVVDACPLEAEDSDGVDDLDGCPDADPPADADGDGVVDGADPCPEVAGSEAGCPPEVVAPARPDGPTAEVVADRIEISERIFFETGSATLTAGSDLVVEAVARLLVAHPELARVEVAGHTDSVGDEGTNLRLSEARAQAVVSLLVASGVDPSRLQARGYGESVPLDSNRTADGQALNRRVEFVIGDGG